jgi:hypothetical protein
VSFDWGLTGAAVPLPVSPKDLALPGLVNFIIFQNGNPHS